ncbi:MAG: ADP-ribosylglycohydrolase family protein [Actinomycetes bacterium]
MKTPAIDAPRHPDARRRSRYRGCLLGICIGDAFGAPVELHRRTAILEAHPPHGVTDLLPRDGLPAGSYTDSSTLA